MFVFQIHVNPVFPIIDYHFGFFLQDEINQLNEALEKQQSQSLFKPKRADPVLTSASSLDTPTASPLTTPYSISTLLGLNAVDNSAKAGAHGDKSAHGATTTNPTTLSTATDLQATTLSPSSSTSTSSASAAKATTKPSTPPSAHVLQDQLRSFIEQYDLREAHFAAMLRASEAEIRVLEAKLVSYSFFLFFFGSLWLLLFVDH